MAAFIQGGVPNIPGFSCPPCFLPPDLLEEQGAEKGEGAVLTDLARSTRGVHGVIV